MALACGAFAQTPSTSESSETTKAEIAALRQMVEKQNQRIEALTREVIRLSRMIEGGSSSGPSVQTSEPSSAAAASAPPSASPPKAEPVKPSGPTHTVIKGETLTIIAKRYDTTVEKLVELNGIKDERLLQIGQVLILPDNANAAPNTDS